MKQNNYFLFLFISCMALLFASCDSNRVYEVNTELPGATWEQANILKFDVDLPDTAKRFNFYINVRNDETYPYSNLYIFLTTHFPDKRISKDTLELLLADENGNWYGKGSGERKFNQILLKKKIKFPVAGKYSFQLEQGMRMAELPGITDAGIRIEYFDE